MQGTVIAPTCWVVYGGMVRVCIRLALDLRRGTTLCVFVCREHIFFCAISNRVVYEMCTSESCRLAVNAARGLLG